MQNGVILQPFQWYSPAGTLWSRLAAAADRLAERGFTAVWFPPAGKGSGGPDDVGYGAFDLFDLGEFAQKGAVRTKYGTKAELLSAIHAVHAAGMQVYVDVAFNHKDGGDGQLIQAQPVDWEDRNRPIDGWRTIEAFTRFDFPVRDGHHSTMKWRSYHFDAVSYDGLHPERGTQTLFRLKDKDFSTGVSHEHGNFDYLMACDLDTSHPEVNGELRWWGRWIIDTTQADGFRIDACKHISSGFFRDWLNHLRTHFGGRELFALGEYWSGSADELGDYLGATEGVMSLFDVPLHYRFVEASRSSGNFDMRTIFDGSLVQRSPAHAVTFVDNHDTQPLQSLESWVENWFKPLAYALILLRRDGYPCVFAGDLEASHYRDRGHDGNDYDIELIDHSFLIDKFLMARRAFGFGDQYDYFDHPSTVGWTRLGDQEHPGAMAVLLSDGAAGDKWMEVRRANARFFDVTGHIPDEVVTNGDGWGHFRCPGGSVSVWLQR